MPLNLREKVLLGLGALGLAKSILGLVRPFVIKRFAGWWTSAAAHVNSLVGGVCILAGIALWAIVLYEQELSAWILAAAGLAFVWMGTIYFRRASFEKLMHIVCLDRKRVALRAIFALGAIISILLIWVALR